jgi:tetratricopeptide (TPR) repeat protein
MARQAADAMPAADSRRLTSLSNLCSVLLARFERLGQRADLDEAIIVGERARQAEDRDDAGRATVLANLGGALLGRFQLTGNLSDLHAAVDTGRAALAATRPEQADRPLRLGSLGTALVLRFDRLGELADLDEAIAHGRDALADIRDGHPDRLNIASYLTWAHMSRCARTGRLTDLDDAVGHSRTAVDGTPTDHPRRGTRLATLATALSLRFRRLGDPGDLDTAISVGRQAASRIPSDDPSRAGARATLAEALALRFTRAGRLADVDEAVQVGRQAVADLPPGHTQRSLLLISLTQMLSARYERTRDRADADDAVSTGRQAVADTPEDRPQRAGALAALATALCLRADVLTSAEDIDEAIRACEQAIGTSPADHPDVPALRCALATALQLRHARTGQLADLDQAARESRLAAHDLDPGHPMRAALLAGMADIHASRFARHGDRADADVAIQNYRAAATEELAVPRLRLLSALGWAANAARLADWEEAAAGYTTAIELLGLVAARSLGRGDQEHLLGEVTGLASAAAVACVRAGQPVRALELLDQGRGVLLGQALDLRTDVADLADQHPELARQFALLGDELDQADDVPSPSLTPIGPVAPIGPVTPSGPTLTGPTLTGPRPDGGRSPAVTAAAGAGGLGVEVTGRWAVERRREVAEAFERLIAQIRQLPGFRDFLRPPDVGTLAAAASHGPVVSVAVSSFGSYALILTPDGEVVPFPLPGLTPEGVVRRIDPAIRPGRGPAAEDKLADTLGWLWDVLAAPVLSRMGFTSPPPDGRTWPRVWWCLSGLMSFLPVHAAGRHATVAEPVPATVMDRVVSSSTPTLRALALVHRRSAAGGARAGRAVVVAMPSTPGANISPLPGTEYEGQQVERTFPGRVVRLVGPDATRDAVLAALRAAAWAHFSCHGESNLAQPSRSRLLLHDHATTPLTVRDVARLRLDRAELAFLSACSTASHGPRLADEVIHLASAFQLAGYRHVIGTLWPIIDLPFVATGFYDGLAQGAEVATALHAAVRTLRRRTPDHPSTWAAHIHIGG